MNTRVTDPEILKHFNTNNIVSENKSTRIVDPEILKHFEQQPGQESFLQKLPRNVVTGLANGGRSFVNMPYDLAQGYKQYANNYEEKDKNQLGFSPNEKNTSNNWADYIPHIPEEFNYAEALGQKGEPTFGDKAVQKTAQYLPEIGTIGSLAKNALPHLTKYGATRTLNKARQLEAERNIGTLNVDPELIRDARQYLPNNLPERNLLKTSQKGDYNSLFDLQSMVGKVSAQRMGKLKKLFAPESQIKGEAGLAARNRLLDAIHENLQSQGHHDISKLLRQGQNEYRRYINFKQKVTNPLAIAALTAGVDRALPGNPFTHLLKSILTKQIQ
jgi:hypothetical protein